MKRYTVYIGEYSYKTEYRPAKQIGGETIGYIRRVNAATRRDALDKCLPSIKAELPKCQGVYVSVYVGETHNPTAFAGRLVPYQITVATGEVRQ